MRSHQHHALIERGSELAEDRCQLDRGDNGRGVELPADLAQFRRCRARIDREQCGLQSACGEHERHAQRPIADRADHQAALVDAAPLERGNGARRCVPEIQSGERMLERGEVQEVAVLIGCEQPAERLDQGAHWGESILQGIR